MKLGGTFLGILLVQAFGCAGAHSGTDPSLGLQGIVELDEVTLAFELGGRVRAVPVRQGEEIQVGTVLAQLDDELERPQRDARAAEAQALEAQAALVRAGSRAEEVRTTLAQLVAARQNEDKARRNVTRQEELIARGAAAPALLDELRSQLARATAEREALQERLAAQRRGGRTEERAAAEARAVAGRALLAAAEVRLDKLILRAPAPARVLDVLVDPGEIVAPGSPVLTVADPKRPYADVFVPEGQLKGVRTGQSATIRVDGDAQSFQGRVEDVGRRTEFTPKFLFSPRERPNLVVRVRVRIEDPGERLHAGIPAFVALEGR